MTQYRFHANCLTRFVLIAACLTPGIVSGAKNLATSADVAGHSNGIIAVLGLPGTDASSLVNRLTAGNGRMIYFQSPSAEEVSEVRRAADAAGLQGTRVFAEKGDWKSIHLADNLVDRVLVAAGAREAVPADEILRILHPGATATLGERKITKERPDGVDEWTHPYHGPDNNPQSTDQYARAPYRTQFLAGPLFSPMPEVTVAANGRIFKAFGHIAHKANQNAVLNTLICINAYNGTEIWRRDLKPGFMIHRNTMIATADALLLADDQSCKVIDATSGHVRDEIFVPANISDGSVWKWMALHDGILYALVGGAEVQVDTVRSETGGLGHWPWGMWKGHDYSDPSTNFGFGRTFVAIDPGTKEVIWNYQDDEYLDSRGVCMADGRIYFYAPDKFLGCINAEDGKLNWKNSDEVLLTAIGFNARAQHYVTGYSTTTYIKCNSTHLFFAGPQRERFVVASTEDGRLLWQKPHGNLQILLRDDGVYCAGPKVTGAKYSYDGEHLSSLPTRRACTRATGSIDSIFYRTSGGTVRVDVAANTAHHIAPMCPPCQDGVIISDSLLYWGPWMCGCQLSLYGHICLAPAGTSSDNVTIQPQLQLADGDIKSIAALSVADGDWPTYRRDNNRSGSTHVAVPDAVKKSWSYDLETGDQLPTAPLIAGGITYVADRRGAVQALGTDGKPIWKILTGGPIYYPPALDNGRLFVGSADGKVYAMEAATGRALWSYRVAPHARRIPVYGKLISTWPVAGGVVVKNDTVFAAAGIAHYDGTYVVALDAATGSVKWNNSTSGELAEDVECGISLQGELSIRGNELQFLGGGAYLIARYDLATGKCLNEPRSAVTSQFRTAFYPYYPTYGKYSSLLHTYPDGRTLVYQATYDAARFTPLRVLAPPEPPTKEDKAKKISRRGKVPVSDAPRKQPQRKAVWQTNQPKQFTAFVLTPQTLLAGGPANFGAETGILSAINIEDGKFVWQKSLPAIPVKSGIAMDHRQQIVVTLENGQVLCFLPE